MVTLWFYLLSPTGGDAIYVGVGKTSEFERKLG